MRMPNFSTLGIALLSSVTAGCFGGGVVYMTECESSVPICNYKYSKEEWGPTENFGKMDYPQVPNCLPLKENFLAEWGRPSDTIMVSEDEVTFVYKTVDIWCGVVPTWGVPVPLVVPACEGFDRITFKGDKATYLQFKRVNKTGFATIPMLWAGGKMPNPCPKPCTPKAQECPQAQNSSFDREQHSQTVGEVGDRCSADAECQEGLFCYRLSSSCQRRE